MITGKQLSLITSRPELKVGKFVDPINAVLKEFSIITPRQQAMFIAQAVHESLGFSALVESLNYGAPALWRVFQRHFASLEEATTFANKPTKIANRVYAGRMGNGDEASGDGWRFRGRGIFQLTGRLNYKTASLALYSDERLLVTPALLEQPEAACRSAGWFWSTHGCNPLADKGDVEGVTRKINGWLNGLNFRQAYYAIALPIISSTS